MNKDYLIEFDADGNRGTTYAAGIHYYVLPDGTTQDGSIKVAEKLAAGYVFVDQDDYANLLGNNDDKQIYIYKDGAFSPKPAYVPTEAETKQAKINTIKAKYNTQLDSLVTARVKAAMLGADTSKIDAQYKSTLTAMSTEIKNA